MKPGSERLVLNFDSGERGAVLDATSSKTIDEPRDLSGTGADVTAERDRRIRHRLELEFGSRH